MSRARSARPRRRRTRMALLGALTLAVFFFAGASLALAGEQASDASWRLEPVAAPAAPAGVAEAPLPIGLGRIGDVEFWTPNRGLLITAGDPPTVPAGLWAYNGVRWHELATVCGGAELAGEGGRIAWAGPEEFFTVSAGRPGQASESSEFVEPPPIVDNTICRFSGGQVVGSYAHPAFRADSYTTMQGAACLSAEDCWFGGDPLAEPSIGSFQLHWNGSTLEAEPYPKEGHTVRSMIALEGRLYESVGVSFADRSSVEEVREPPVLHRINPEGVQPPFQSEARIPLYGEGELAEALEGLDLATAEGALWGAAGPQLAQRGEPGQLTVVRREKGVWSQLIGPQHPIGPLFAVPSEEEALLGKAEHPGEVRARDAVVTSIAAEPGTDSAWIALRDAGNQGATARALILRVSAEGRVLEEQTLPSAAEQAAGVGPKGAAEELSCPAVNDCWLATTDGWLFHLAPESERTLPADEAAAFRGVITYRPPDRGLPQIPPDAPPPDTSGLVEEAPGYGGKFEEQKGSPQIEATVAVPLLSNVRSRLIDGTTLQLSFHLAVKARVRLLAKHNQTVVATTPTRTLRAGERSLTLRLQRRRWPTKLALQTHALAPLPVEKSSSSNVSSISTGFFVLPRDPLLGGSGLAR